jgi:hypothetical protein
MDVPESVPPPLTVQLTPAFLLSLATVALSFTASVGSTDAADAVTVTLGVVMVVVDEEPPPQPERKAVAAMNPPTIRIDFENMLTPQN